MLEEVPDDPLFMQASIFRKRHRDAPVVKPLHLSFGTQEILNTWTFELSEKSDPVRQMRIVWPKVLASDLKGDPQKQQQQQQRPQRRQRQQDRQRQPLWLQHQEHQQ